MTDLELIELAAKCAGYGRVDSTTWPECTIIYKDNGDHIHWNPLEDSGDALQLACDLKLDIEIADCVTLVSNGLIDEIFAKEYDTNGDRSAVTRRAIVRCAAAMGRAES